MYKFLLVLLLFSSCEQNDFYNAYQTNDLWRLPLIKPYDLKNVAGAKSEDYDNDNWHLEFRELNKAIYAKGVNVTMINVDKGIIYGYGNKAPTGYFIINTISSDEKVFKDINEWSQALIRLKVNSEKTFDVFEAFTNFKEKGILPWKQNQQ